MGKTLKKLKRYLSKIVKSLHPSAADEPMSYHSTMLDRQEYYLMMELESLVGGEIPKVSEMMWDTFGFIVSDRHLVQLGLFEKELSSLPEIITKMTYLEALGLGGNNLSSLPDTISNLRSLNTLDLSQNNLSSLPDTIGTLKLLTFLDLENNNLSSLPENIGALTSLKTLSLYHNNLQSLPESIGSLKSIKRLDLEKNKLDPLPLHVKKQLQKLKDNGCSISGIEM
ncbi:MAG: hypothetical protein GF364_21440 [Candidatus Lokiarchaeota archaeon]|nr:hypothetical protein [Candidatus Lokiarchaeota archaeon]